MSKQSFAKGAVILAGASIISRLLGAWYVVALPRIIREEGMGLLQMVRPFYNLVVILSAAGLPVALSKLTAEQFAIGNTRGAVQIFKLTLALLLVSGAVFAGILGAGSRWLVENILRDPLAYPALLALVPSVFFLGAASAFRGFPGHAACDAYRCLTGD